MRPAGIDHRFDGEEHARLQFRTGSGARGVDHFGRIVEQSAEAVTAEFLHDSIAELARMRFDRCADIAQPRARLRRRLDAEHEAFIGHIDQLAAP